MPLKIQIKSGQQIIINGAVVENVSHRTASLLIKNEAAILREEDILTAEDAVTPASRLYYALQCLYLFPQSSDHYLPLFKKFAEGYLKAAPSSGETVEAVRKHVDEEHLYAALKKAQALIDHEGKVLSHVQQRHAEELRGTAVAGEPEGDGSLGADPGGTADEGEPGSS